MSDHLPRPICIANFRKRLSPGTSRTPDQYRQQRCAGQTLRLGRPARVYVSSHPQDTNGWTASGRHSAPRGRGFCRVERGDGRRYGAHMAIGAQTADGKGHVVAYGDYYKRQPIFAGARVSAGIAASASDPSAPAER